MPIPESAVAFIAEQVQRVRQFRTRKRIVFPEGGDARVVAAAERLAREELADPILIGPRPATAPPLVTFLDPSSAALAPNYAAVYFERRRARGVTQMEAAEIARHPLYLAALMVEAGDADGFVGGAVYSSADTLRALLQCIGTPSSVRTLSSVFVLAVHNRAFGHNGLLALADCSVVIEPTSVELAEIAIATAESARTLLNTEPVIAMLSFSTKGSGKHKEVDRVVEALRIVRARAPELHVDGELQADTALVPAVARLKAPGSTVAGRANTLIFPDLNSANIGYKLAERLSGGVAIGPFLQGLAKPANDLSRGCTVEEIFGVAVVTARQALDCRAGS